MKLHPTPIELVSICKYITEMEDETNIYLRYNGDIPYITIDDDNVHLTSLMLIVANNRAGDYDALNQVYTLYDEYLTNEMVMHEIEKINVIRAVKNKPHFNIGPLRRKFHGNQ